MIQRVAIIGAGAAGLSAARALQAAGHQPVVFEREPQVGGKCRTVAVDGRTYELGAVLRYASRADVGDLWNSGHQESRVVLDGAYVADGGRRIAHPAPARTDASWRELTAAAARLAVTMVKHRGLFRPGLAGLDPSLGRPFKEWADRPSLELCGRLYEPYFTAFGYGYLSEIPAAYLLKYITTVRPFAHDIRPDGFQGLCAQLARGLDVRLESEVLCIERSDTVRVHTSQGEEAFDALVMACPLDDASRFLDTTAEERALFSRIRYQRYVCLLADIEGPPLRHWGFFMDNLDPGRRGQPMLWFRRWPDRQTINFYALVDEGGEGDVADAVARTLAPLGRGLRDVRAEQVWSRYAPHVGPDDVAGGWYDRMEALQGRRRTYYAGETLAYGMVQWVVRHAAGVVHRLARPA